MNIVVEICLIIKTIQAYIIELIYPANSSTWIKSYYSIILDQDKELNTKAFKTFSNKNTKCIIFMTTDTYEMKNDNPDIWLIV